MPWTRIDLTLAAKPVTLANIRGHGQRTILVYCGNHRCHHQAELDADRWDDGVTFGDLQPRMLCTVCDHLGADVRPAWRETGMPRR